MEQRGRSSGLGWLAMLSQAPCWKELSVSRHLLKSILPHLHRCLTKGKVCPEIPGSVLGCLVSFPASFLRFCPCALPARTKQRCYGNCKHQAILAPALGSPAGREIMAFVVIYWMLMLSRLYPQALTRDTLTLHHQCSVVNFPSLVMQAGDNSAARPAHYPDDNRGALYFPDNFCGLFTPRGPRALTCWRLGSPRSWPALSGSGWSKSARGTCRTETKNVVINSKIPEGRGENLLALGP
uniref:uncharacterized protein LOC132692093 n=1 Tax=Panthera onca TaxID=9690 RepID=UPI002953B3F9|nr:uncharacterized protein LOC132692093 [Panthera onca]